MNLASGLRYGALGFVADLFLPQLTMGQGRFMGLMYGLFRPDAQDMTETYEPSRFGAASMDRVPTGERTYTGEAPPSEDLFAFGARPFTRSSAVNIPKYFRDGALSIAAGSVLNTVGRGFQYPTWLAAANNAAGGEYMPYTARGHRPDLWRNGLIPDWGWSRGTIY